MKTKMWRIIGCDIVYEDNFDTEEEAEVQMKRYISDEPDADAEDFFVENYEIGDQS